MMPKLWMIGLAGIVLAGCAVTPSAENTMTGLEEIEMEETTESKSPETGSPEESTLESEVLPGVLLFDFQPGSERWNSVDDNVMGGVSSSNGRILDEGYLLFSGNMSLENNGGFS